MADFSLNQSIQLVKNMGLRYAGFRLWYELQKKSGRIKTQYPTNPEKIKFITLVQWRQSFSFWGITKEAAFETSKFTKPDISFLMAGYFPFFSADKKLIGKDFDWLTNPDTGYKYDATKPWWKVDDYNKVAGDIKYVWEKSRFAYLYDIIRHDKHTGIDHSDWVFQEIASWIESNPINSGPNYKCSQEISLRVLNWTYALNYYKDSENLTESLFQEIMHAIYWQLKHVYSNINFSRIAVRNNHAITETLALYIGGSLYTFFPESQLWKKQGKKWFEEEINYQIYTDGTFLQFSMNYHRVVIQLLTWALRSAEYFNDTLKPYVYEKAYKSLVFLNTCQDSYTGWLPNYGSNDGALFFKFTECDYRDYRPQLNSLHLLLTGKELYNAGGWNEDAIWYNLHLTSQNSHHSISPPSISNPSISIPSLSNPSISNPSSSQHKFPPIKLAKGWHQFPVSGYYILREPEGITLIRCGNHTNRPAHADNLHIDIWHKGKNILFDAGSYKYNTAPEDLKYFMGTESHNTIMLDRHDQMLKGARFIWYNWSQATKAQVADNPTEYIFEGEIKAFSYLNLNIRHKRIIRKLKDQPVWIIADTIIDKPDTSNIKQYWHCLLEVKLSAIDQDSNTLNIVKETGWRSDYYGIKEPTDQYVAVTPLNSIVTRVEYQKDAESIS